MQYKGFELDRFQEDAFKAIEAGKSLLVAAPTGSGKTVIAEYAIERSMAEGRSVVYTAPIKALSNQKYRDFSALYPGKVGILTGDVTINPDAPILIMTTEIYRNSLFESPERVAKARYVIFDEVHYMSDVERGTVWEESILFAPPDSRLLCLSATVSNLDELAAWIREVRGEPIERIVERRRAVPLQLLYYVRDRGMAAWEELKYIAAEREHRRHRKRRPRGHVDTALPHAIKDRHLPCLYFAFNRRRCEELAYHYRRFDLLRPDERTRLLTGYDALARRFGVERGEEAKRMRGLVERGIAFHHAGLLPTTKEIVEQSFNTGHVKLLFATETFAMGVNMPAKAVVFDNLVKFDGVEIDFLPARDFQQMAGRAGRRGKDKLGFVYATLEKRDLDLPEIRRTVQGEPAGVQSQFNLSYASILRLYERMEERIYDTVERSFGVYQARQQDPRERDRAVQAWRNELRAKIAVLDRLGYLEKGKITKKGEFAKKVSGHELVVSELYWSGLWAEADPASCAVLAVAVATEPRKNEWNRFPPEEAVPVKGKAVKLVRDLQKLELRAQVRLPVKDLRFDLAAVAWAWATGHPFERLHEFTSEDPGDLVRNFRQAIQVLRQLQDALPVLDPLRPRLAEAIARINRDEVDAERLLRS